MGLASLMALFSHEIEIEIRERRVLSATHADAVHTYLTTTYILRHVVITRPPLFVSCGGYS